MDDVAWWITNNIFTFMLWMLLDSEGRKVAIGLWVLMIILSIFLLTRTRVDND